MPEREWMEKIYCTGVIISALQMVDIEELI